MIDAHLVHPGARLVATRPGFGGREIVRDVLGWHPDGTLRYLEHDPAIDHSLPGSCQPLQLRKWASGRHSGEPVRFHPLCTLFPLDQDLVEQLAGELRAHGQTEPIVMLDGQVLDGRHRMLACGLAEVLPRTVDFEDVAVGLDPEAWVWAANFHRRQLTLGQRSILAARLVELRRADPHRGPGRLSEAVAPELDVSSRTVENATVVLRHGAPELVQAVEQGVIKVTPAADLATLPKDEQRAILATADPSVLRGAAAEARKRAKADAEARRAADEAAKPAPHKCAPGIELRCGDVSEAFAAGALQARPALIHADPPWDYRNNGGNGAAEGHYPVMTNTEIALCLQRAHRMVGPDAYMLLWVTAPKLAEAILSIDLNAQWEYVTSLTWTKPELGLGHHARGQHELLLVFRKGAPRLFGPAPPSHHHQSRQGLEHSEKPEGWLRELLPVYTPPGGLVLDLFAGLGSCARAARAVGLPYAGWEVVPARYREALRRLEPPEPMPLFAGAGAEVEPSSASRGAA